MSRILLVLALVAAVVGLPFLLKPRENLLARADDTLVIVSPHNEAIRYEFSRAFGEAYRRQTGRSVRIDWRTPGGTSEIARYLKGEFLAAFERHWRELGRPWEADVAAAFDNPKVVPADAPAFDSPAQAARRAFLNSQVGIGIDLFFGGGAFDFQQQAAAGRLVASGVMQRHPEWFTETSLPAELSGEPFRDPEGRWIGACLSAFGICYNLDSLARLGIASLPTRWADLAQPVFFRQVALADPTKSGSANKAFEMIVQREMQEISRETGSDEPAILASGWAHGLQIIQAASANARYFTDSAGKVPVDVSLGDAAIGLCIDFYGRTQSEAVAGPDGKSRMRYFTPEGGSSVGVDPIALLRGAPHPAVAEAFIDFVLSIEGQKLWNFRVGTPGGPTRYALRRLPVRRELYVPEFQQFFSDPGVNPYATAGSFTYRAAWTAPLFKSLSFIVRVMCLDVHEEQVAAWQALIRAGFPKQATEKFRDVSAVAYEVARTQIRPTLSANDRLEEVRLARELANHFRTQYREAEQLALEGR